MNRTAVLVCEGACNPTRTMLEQLVDADSWKDDKGRLMRGSKVTALRVLVHTPHTWKRRTATGHRYQCDVCGKERSYG